MKCLYVDKQRELVKDIERARDELNGTRAPCLLSQGEKTAMFFAGNALYRLARVHPFVDGGAMHFMVEAYISACAEHIQDCANEEYRILVAGRSKAAGLPSR